VVDPAAEGSKPPQGLQFGNYSFEIGVMGDDGKPIKRFKFKKPSILSIAYEPGALLASSGQSGLGEESCYPELMLYDTERGCHNIVPLQTQHVPPCRHKPTSRRG
jgi:hypothetical protein